MGSYASKQVDKFIEFFVEKAQLEIGKERERAQVRKDFKDYYGYDIDVIREYGPFKGFKAIKHAYDDLIDYRRDYKHNYVKTFYNPDGSVNEAKVDKEIEKRKEEFVKYYGKSYEEYINVAYSAYGQYEKDQELTSLFNDYNTDKLFFEVGANEDGYILIVNRWYLDAIDNFDWLVNGIEQIILDERIWPHDELIQKENKQIKEKLLRRWEQDKKNMKVTKRNSEYKQSININPFENRSEFKYYFGSPAYIEYFLKQLPAEKRKKYNGSKWTHAFQKFYVTKTSMGTSRMPENREVIVSWDE